MCRFFKLPESPWANVTQWRWLHFDTYAIQKLLFVKSKYPANITCHTYSVLDWETWQKLCFDKPWFNQQLVLKSVLSFICNIYTKYYVKLWGGWMCWLEQISVAIPKKSENTIQLFFVYSRKLNTLNLARLNAEQEDKNYLIFSKSRQAWKYDFRHRGILWKYFMGSPGASLKPSNSAIKLRDK